MAVWVRDRSFYKTLLLLSLPVVAQNVVTFGTGFIGNVMVGSLGKYAIAGVFQANQIQSLLQMILLGTSGALQVLSTQYWGRRDVDHVKSIVAIAFRLTFVLTTALWLATVLWPTQIVSLFTNDAPTIAEGVRFLRYAGLSYVFFGISQLLIQAMRSVEDVKVGFLVSILTFCSSLLLNGILVKGWFGIASRGVEGAGIAIVVARALEAGAMVLYLAFGDRRLRMEFRDLFRFDPLLRRDYYKYGLPVIAGQLVWATNQLAGNAIVGRLGPEAMSAASIAGMMYMLVSIVSLGVAQGVGIITGKTVGAGEYEKMKLYARTIQLIFVGIGFLATFVVLLGARPLLSLYDVDEATRTVALQFMTVLVFTAIGTNYQGMCLGGLVRAGGDTSFVFLNDTIFVFLTVLPSAFLAAFVFHAPAWVVFACLKSDQLTKVPVAIVKINRFRWMKNLTRAKTPDAPVLAAAAAEPAE